MKHAAHKAANGSRQGVATSRSLFSPTSGSHSAKAVRMVQMANGNGAILGLDQAVADKLNELAPQTRRAMREAARAAERRSHILASASLAALVGTAATAVAFAGPDDLSGSVFAADPATTTTQLNRITTNVVSRSEDRTPLTDTVADGTAAASGAAETTDAPPTEQVTADGQWLAGDANTVSDVNQLSRSTADNPVVAALMDGDYDLLPEGFNPNHATGDTGNAYEFSQCTWWVYVRRHQLGLPVGSYFGNGCMWANSARALGYWVDNTPRHVGDIMVFAAGQAGSDATYGHVAIVEQINPDGSIVTSECGSVMNGETYSRTYTNVSDFQFIHY
ncbi:CHAP domain-containing protein [Bifidobacterium phasiani]|uniref:CHAP domain-containing protein n=1 Tax=Bifidobacterium phasiani TaxID=2834431 RepID=A0ABS6WAU2_9BIFI|nr:CHAP domain-containing protein [Bifidobacterium phasiani]MBW3083621.1 CHAP domain-containing protein [Bifidobacterium phasiani]